MTHPIFSELSISVDRGWNGVVGPNGSGKTTFLELAAGILEPELGSVSRPDDMAFCHQRTDTPSDLIRQFLDASDGEAWRLRGILCIEYDWLDRWNTLSHGERKRMQIGSCLWRAPQMLVVDEPTNHLDSQARNQVAQALETFSGLGLLVSHDRDLLDNLCHNTVFIRPGSAENRSGSYTGAAEQIRAEMERERERYRIEKKNLERLRREEVRRRELAAHQQVRRSKRGIPIHDHDARFKKNRARISGKDGVGGKLLRQMDGSIRQAEDRLSSIRLGKIGKSGITIATELVKSDAICRLEETRIPLGDVRSLSIPALTVGPRSRIGIVGPNGSGKSTLVSRIVNTLTLGPDAYVYIPQEISMAETEELHLQLRRMTKTELGHAMSAVSRLGSAAGRVIESAAMSPGETRKLLLAMGIARSPALVVMDEPTNHMDLPSIESIERAISETICALLLVSHDRRFLHSLVDEVWNLKRTGDDYTLERKILP